jgi:phosphatidylglycerol---prolipoprotein diacylglyceryl transferase
MQQILFWIPIKFSWFPEGIPVYAYGAMLFLTFVACVWFAGRRAAKIGLNLPRERIQDLAIVLFIFGLAGARLTYMLQFDVPLQKFFRIWEGGIVLYGGIIGGAAAFILFHRYVLRKFNITLWQMGDLAAPCVCIGIALGRVGCLMNGCCYGNIANPDCPDLEFPLLTSPAREMLVGKDGLQTVAGFLPRRDYREPDDVRTVVSKVEPNSPAAKAGLKEGDKIVKIKVASDWQPNGEVLIVSGKKAAVAGVVDIMKGFGTSADPESIEGGEIMVKITVDSPENFGAAYGLAKSMMAAESRDVRRLDVFSDMLDNWPRGRNSVQFVVERDGQETELPAFTPRSIGLHPTQLYEIISMALLLFLVLSYYPFRRHDGQVWVLFMAAYAVHRFLNEILRIEPVEGLKMTLSQNISVLVLLGAIALEVYLRQTQPKRVHAAV